MSHPKEKIKSPAERHTTLAARKNSKMAASAHAYVRGSTAEFYQWLRARSARSIPVSPPIWICGDCHVGNLGPVANAEGEIDIQIRDFDQTVVGNAAHDLIRLGLSLATAARGSDLPGVTTAHILEHLVEGYERAMSPRPRPRLNRTARPESVRVIMRRAMARTWKHLAKERLEDVKPNIPLGERFWPLSKSEKTEIARLFKEDELRRLVTALKFRKTGARIEVLDAAYWMKGCSSLGRMRYAVLLGVGKAQKSEDFCLVDIKQAVSAVAPRLSGSRMPRDNGRRVVKGARRLAPYLGERMTAGRFLNRSVFIRELLPQDLKLEIDQLTRDEAVDAASYLAGVVGIAHARQMSAELRAKWRNTLRRGRSERLDAPSWLWTSVVDLIAKHETGYLEHCRRHSKVLHLP